MLSMTLKVLLPFEIFINESSVTRIVVETAQGAFGLLPQRLDCVAALVPGILIFQAKNEVFVALDEGVMIKTGAEVVISVRRAARSDDLAQLRDTVQQEFLEQDEHDEELHVAMARLESGFMRRFTSMQDAKS